MIEVHHQDKHTKIATHPIVQYQETVKSYQPQRSELNQASTGARVSHSQPHAAIASLLFQSVLLKLRSFHVLDSDPGMPQTMDTYLP